MLGAKGRSNKILLPCDKNFIKKFSTEQIWCIHHINTTNWLSSKTEMESFLQERVMTSSAQNMISGGQNW